MLADLGFVSNSYLASLKRYGTGGGDADRNANVGRVTKAALVAGFYPQAGAASTRHFSAQPESFVVTQTTQYTPHHPIHPSPPNTPHATKYTPRIPQKLLTSSRKVDEC